MNIAKILPLAALCLVLVPTVSADNHENGIDKCLIPEGTGSTELIMPGQSGQFGVSIEHDLRPLLEMTLSGGLMVDPACMIKWALDYIQGG